MARQKDLLSRLADAGEEAIQRLGDVPGADRITGAMNTMRDRMDEMQKRLRGLDALEKRLTALEKRVESMGGGKGGSTGRAASSSRTASSARSPRAATSTGKSDPGAATSGRGRKTGGSAGAKKSPPKKS